MWANSFVLTCVSACLCSIALALLVSADETVEDAAFIARMLVNSSSIGTMATVYPREHATLAGEPFALQEYYASCHTNGSLTLLVLPISRHSQNVLHSPAHAASLTVASDPPRASRPRVALLGTVTIFPVLDATPDLAAVQACYLEQHPDARWWLPGPREPHVAYWARFDPHTVYFVGGFGDEHYIGYVPLEMYQTALLRAPRAGTAGSAGRLLVDQQRAL